MCDRDHESNTSTQTKRKDRIGKESHCERKIVRKKEGQEGNEGREVRQKEQQRGQSFLSELSQYNLQSTCAIYTRDTGDTSPPLSGIGPLVQTEAHACIAPGSLSLWMNTLAFISKGIVRFTNL